MKTTIQIDDELVQETKKLALATGRTFAAVVEDALREALSRSTQPRPGLGTLPGRGLLRDIDLDDSAALGDLMDQPS